MRTFQIFFLTRLKSFCGTSAKNHLYLLFYHRLKTKRPSRSKKGQCSKNYKDFHDELLTSARSLSWLFVNKGDLQPIVTLYNTVMWPTGMTVRQNLNLEKKPAKTKITTVRRQTNRMFINAFHC